MNIGTQAIQDIIVEQLRSANYRGNCGHSKFAKDLTKRIFDLLEPGMNTEWNTAHNFPDDLEPVVRKLENGLGLRMKRDERAAEIYRWVVEQEKAGRPMKKFIEWAVDTERVKYVGKYRNSPEAIRIDYKQAFETVAVSRPKAETL